MNAFHRPFKIISNAWKLSQKLTYLKIAPNVDDKAIIWLFYQDTKKHLVATYLNTTKNQPIRRHLMFLRHKRRCFDIKKIRDEVISQLFEGLTTKPIKGGSEYIHVKLKNVLKRRNEHGKNVLKRIFMVETFHMMCSAMQKQC